MKGLSVAISLLFAMLLGLFPALVQAATGDIVSVAPGTLTLSAPAGVAVDSLGNLYIADSSNNRVLMVAAGTGTVSTVGASANLSLGLNHPSSVAVDSTGAIYINDGAINHRVLKVAADGQSFGTVAGLTHPYNIAVDSADNLYVADFNDNIVQMVAADGTVSTVAGTAAPVSGDGGQATSAQLFGPINVALDSDGNLYITEYFHNTVRMVTNVDHGNLIYTVAGNTLQGFSGDGGPAASARLSLGSSSGLALDAKGNLYIADTGNNRVRKVSAVASLSGTMTTVAGTGVAGASGDNGPALAAQLNQPYAVALDASGNLYISDRGNNKVRKVVDLPVVTASSPGGTFSAPQNVTLSSNKPATIYYTVDSSTPTTGSPVFPAQGLTIGANTTLTYFAVDASGNQSAPATLGFVVLPGAPGNVQATSGNAFATVSFSAPGFSAGSPITSYTVTSNPGNISASGSASPVTVTGLTNGTTYSFTVTASNGINNSPASAASNSVTPYLLTLSIGAPSKSFLKQGDSVSFVVSYVGATGITLGSGDVTLNTTGTASGSVAVSGTGTLARSVTISNVTGNGSLGISIASGTATGGPLSAAAAGPSATSTVDSAAPTLAVATLGGNTTTSNNTLRVTGSVLDADGIASVTLNGVSQTLTGGAFNSALALSPGANLISVVATDLAGNQTSDIRTISYDPTAPLVGFAAATPADGSSTDQQAATVAGTLDRPCSVSVAVGSASPVVVNTGGTDNSFSVPVTLGAGSNSIVVVATDSAVPASSSTVLRTVSFNSTNPALAISDPSQDISTSAGSYLLKGSVSSAFAGSNAVLVAVDGVALSPLPTINADGNFQQSVSFSQAKTYHISVTATDGSNTTTSQRNIVFIPPPDAVALGSVSAVRGKTASVPVTLTNSSGALPATVSFDIGYDPTLLSNPTAALGAAGSAAGKTLAGSVTSAGVFHVTLSDAGNAPLGNGVLANVSFGVAATAVIGSSIPLTIAPSASDPSGTGLAVNGTGGAVTVLVLPGDCNGDNSVSPGEFTNAINKFVGRAAAGTCVGFYSALSVTPGYFTKVINAFMGR